MIIPTEQRQLFFQKLRAAQHVLIVPHSIPNPDGDCLGSALACWHYCQHIGTAATVFCSHDTPEQLSFLPGHEHIVHDPAAIAQTPYDLVLIVDFGELSRSGLADELQAAQRAGIDFMMVDHHATGHDDVGNPKIVIPEASATCEMIYSLFADEGITISKDMATCLLTGLITDTQNFTNGATTVGSLHAAAELVRAGARPHEVIDRTWKNKQVKILQLWGKILLRLHEDPQTGIVKTAIMLKDLEDAGVPLDAADGMSNFLNNLGTAKAVMVLRQEQGGKVKGSMRTTHRDVDVSVIAQQYGGGGHKMAAGFLTDGEIIWDDVRGWLIAGVDVPAGANRATIPA